MATRDRSERPFPTERWRRLGSPEVLGESASALPTRLVALILALALVSAGCDGLGGPKGEYESLENELAVIRETTLAVIEESLGEVEVVGERVTISPCDPDPRYAGDLVIVLRDDELPPEQARSQVLDWLAENEIPLDSDRPDLSGRPVDFTPDDVEIFMVISTGRVSDLEFGGNSGCYGRSQIDADDPFSLVTSRGERLVYVP